MPNLSLKLKLLTLISAVALAYASALSGDFVWIDHSEIEEGGYRVTDAADFSRLWSSSLDQFLFREDGGYQTRGGYWRPLYALGLSVDWWLWGDRAWLWHLENIVWHAGVVILLFLLGRYLCEDQSLHNPAFWAALLFAVHPLGVHSVTWISGRKDLQCAFFGVLAVLCYEQLGQSRRDWLWGTASCVAFLAALGFKELAFCVPVWLLLRSLWQLSTGRRLTRSHVCTFLGVSSIALLVVVYRYAVLGGIGLNAQYPSDSLLQNFATHARLGWHYVGRTLFPFQPQISDRWLVTRQLGLYDLAAIVGLVAMLSATIWAWFRRMPPAMALAWYLVWMLPASGLLALQHVRAERYLYPASWGLLLFLVLSIDRLVRSHSKIGPIAISSVWLTLAVGLGAHTAIENRNWQDDATLFGVAVEREPNYLEGHIALAELAVREKRFAECIRHSERATQIAADESFAGYWSPYIAHTNYALALLQSGHYEEAGDQFAAALRQHPDSAGTKYHLGLVAVGMREYDQAERRFEEVLRQIPDDYLATSKLAFVKLRQGDAQRCRDLLVPLVRARPTDAGLLRRLGTAELLLQQYETATTRFRALVELNAADAVDYAKLAWSEAGSGRLSQAKQHLQHAKRLAPNNPSIGRIERVIADLVGGM